MPAASTSLPGISLFDNKQGDKLRPIFALLLRRSSGHHPLLAGALSKSLGPGLLLLSGGRRASP